MVDSAFAYLALQAIYQETLKELQVNNLDLPYGLGIQEDLSKIEFILMQARNGVALNGNKELEQRIYSHLQTLRTYLLVASITPEG